MRSNTRGWIFVKNGIFFSVPPRRCLPTPGRVDLSEAAVDVLAAGLEALADEDGVLGHPRDVVRQPVAAEAPTGGEGSGADGIHVEFFKNKNSSQKG